MSAFAFVWKDGRIDIGTVSETVLGAQVNAIFMVSETEFVPTRNMTDRDIEKLFKEVTSGKGGVAPVKVELA